MGNLLTVFFSSFVIALTGAMMPGPMLTATITQSSRHGSLAGPLIVAGHAVLELALLVALMMGLAPFLNRDSVFVTISLAGGAVLLWMAAGIFKSLPGLSLQRETSRELNSRRLVMTGVMTSLANPYWTVWWATIGLGYVLHCRQYGYRAVGVFFAGHILADLAWYAAVSVTIGKGRKFLPDAAYRVILAVCGVLLALFSCGFVCAAIRRLAGR